MALFSFVIVTLLGVLGALLYSPVRHFTVTLGIRPFENSANIHGSETYFIPDTVSCEDLEYHAPSGMLYTACVGDSAIARGWTPGAEALNLPHGPPFGSLVVINPLTLKSQKLVLENFKGPFGTHGIALYTPPSQQDVVYIYAINHLPNPAWTEGSKTENKAASQVELFVHTVGSDTARHVRSIAHPLIRTPNDIIAVSETEFVATNDHYYREGPMRLLEEFAARVTSWTDMVHVRFDDESVSAAVALDSIPTNNGISWGPNGQVIVGDALAGHIYFGSILAAESGGHKNVSVSHRIPVDSVVDNANYFTDPYAGFNGGDDYSGYLMPGISTVTRFLAGFKDPAVNVPGRVWYLPAVAGRQPNGAKEAGSPRLIFKDDGRAIRGVTTAVLVPIDPATNDGKRQGWLFVTSVIGDSMLATKIDLEAAWIA